MFMRLLETWAGWQISNPDAYKALVLSTALLGTTLGAVLTIVATAIARAWRG